MEAFEALKKELMDVINSLSPESITNWFIYDTDNKIEIYLNRPVDNIDEFIKDGILDATALKEYFDK